MSFTPVRKLIITPGRILAALLLCVSPLYAVDTAPGGTPPSDGGGATTDLAATSYVFKDLGTLSGNTTAQSMAFGIGPTGHITGWSDANVTVVGTGNTGNTTTLVHHAFSYFNGRMTDVGVVTTGLGSMGFSINSSGVVAGVGNFSSSVFVAATNVTGNFVGIGGSTTKSSVAFGINNLGHAAGFIDVSSNVTQSTWYNGFKTVTIADLGGNSSEALGLNDADQIVGWSLTKAGKKHGFIFTSGFLRDLGSLFVGTSSEATAINELGQVVGFSSTTTGNTTVEHGYFFSEGKATDLGSLGGNETEPDAMNNVGDVVGVSTLTSGNTTFEPFLYSNGTIINLNDAASSNITITGLNANETLQTATGINDGGQIVGSFLTASGNTHAYLLTPTSEATPPTVNRLPRNTALLVGSNLTIVPVAINGTVPPLISGGSNPLHIQWFRDGHPILHANNDTLVLTNLTVANTANYSVTVTNLVGSASTHSNVTIVVTPGVGRQPASDAVVTGNTAKFTATPTGTPPISYIWQTSTDGGTTWSNVTNSANTTTSDIVSGNRSETLMVANTTLASSGDLFRCIINNPINAPVTTAPATLTVGTPPVITAKPVSLTSVQGTDATFSATATGTPAPTYQWLKGTTILTGQTNSTLTLTSVQAADAGSYTIKVTSPFKTVSASATLKVILLPAIATQPASVSVAPGKPARFTLKATGTAPLTYQWQISSDGGTNWTNIDQATAATFSIAKTTLPMNGQQFRCIVNNSTATPVISNPVTLSVGS